MFVFVFDDDMCDVMCVETCGEMWCGGMGDGVIRVMGDDEHYV